jgi:DNA mismatch repair protein MSH5
MQTEGEALTYSQQNSIKTGSGDKITYLYRVMEGLSLESHAGKCAILCGLPARIVQRAGYVRYNEPRFRLLYRLTNFNISELISQHQLSQLLDEGMNEKERDELKAAEDICRRFLAWQLDERDGKNAKDKLAEILGREEGDQA